MIVTKCIDKQIKEYGDYQTPEHFVEKVCQYIKNQLNFNPDVIFEPTFGTGNFIIGSIKSFDSIKKILGLEINNSYYDYAKNKINSILYNRNNIYVNLLKENIFTFDFDNIKNDISKNDNILIIGNPPWITNSELSSFGSYNLPFKDNFKGLIGLDAITGKGNFDVAEYIILQLLSEFKNYSNCYIAMLCKNIVAKNIIKDLPKYDFTLSSIKMLSFDAFNIFNVSCEASLLVMKLGKEKHLVCDVYDFNNPIEKIRMFGWVERNFISDIKNYNNSKNIDGKCQFMWRQGIKHDCSKVMELSIKQNDGTYYNGFKDKIDIEDNYIYPILKSSDLKKFIITKTRKNVIITQKKINEETYSIKEKSPKLWKYLEKHSIYLDNRKSSIYNKSPKFSIFGVGDYSFKPYKVSISGFYKEPIFALVYGDKPIMLDDTCYFIGFDDYKNALITMLLMNSNIVQKFLKSIAFLDSKRPYTKDILMRIDLVKVINNIEWSDLIYIAKKLTIKPQLTNLDIENFIKSIKEKNSLS